jgi:2-(1,2-epoxy-1,2-dihydrophenyl)acetyl-CoA isomerase
MTLPQIQPLLLRRRDIALWITLNRPESGNPIGQRVADELNSIFAAIPSDPSIRAVFLDAAGADFCMGLDKEEIQSVLAGSAQQADPLTVIGHSIGVALRTVSQCAIPVVTICQGTIASGGLGLACVADRALLVADARIQLNDAIHGVSSSFLAPFLAQRIDQAKANRLVRNGEEIGATEALGLGIGQEIVPDLNRGLERVDEILNQIENRYT